MNLKRILILVLFALLGMPGLSAPRASCARAYVAEPQHLFIFKPTELSEARAKFGEPYATHWRSPADNPIWILPPSVNYVVDVLFPAGVADERFYLNEGRLESTLCLETKEGGTIQKKWYLRLKYLPDHAKRAANSRTGTLRALLAGKDLYPIGRISRSTEKALNEQTPYASYFIDGMEDVHPQFISLDGTERMESGTVDGRVAYLITPEEYRFLQGLAAHRRGSGSSHNHSGKPRTP